MKAEQHKTANPDEFVFLRLNRLKSARLCEILISEKLKQHPNPSINDSIVKAKSVGLSSAIESALGYWQIAPLPLNARILSRYYFMLQLTIAEQVSRVQNVDTLTEVQKHTEQGHGLALMTEDVRQFPFSTYIVPLQSGHFSAYAKAIGQPLKEYSVSKRPKKVRDVAEQDRDKVISVVDLFRRIPELMRVIEEYLRVPPLSFHVNYSDYNQVLKSEELKKTVGLKNDRQMPATDSIPSKTQSYVDIHSHSDLVTSEYVASLPTPFEEIVNWIDPIFHKNRIRMLYRHPPGVSVWWQGLPTYKSAYANMSFAIPLWGQIYDPIMVNYALLYALGIIVRYQPDLWYRIHRGDLNHIGSLIEYYISIMDHVLPLQMLERITETHIQIHLPGSFEGQI